MVTSYQLSEGLCTTRLYQEVQNIIQGYDQLSIASGSGGMEEIWEGSVLALWRGSATQRDTEGPAFKKRAGDIRIREGGSIWTLKPGKTWQRPGE